MEDIKHCNDCYYFDRDTMVCVRNNESVDTTKIAYEQFKPITELYKEVLVEAFDR